jgi:spore germination cell wall hydrolase CwlJ-like protein
MKIFVRKLMADTDYLTDLQIVARTLDGEAGNQGYAGQQGVANVIQNRIVLVWQGETTARGVCLHRLQFDCWSPGVDRNRIMASGYIPPSQCLLIARTALNGTLTDITQGATHYFDDSIEPPIWAAPARFTVKIGSLNFYNLNPKMPDPS